MLLRLCRVLLRLRRMLLRLRRMLLRLRRVLLRLLLLFLLSVRRHQRSEKQDDRRPGCRCDFHGVSLFRGHTSLTSPEYA